MIIWIIFSVIFVSACITLAFSMIQRSKIRKSVKMSDEDFTVMIPNIVLIIGATGILVFVLVMLCFAFLSDERPHFIFYVTFGLFCLIGVYLILKTLSFKVAVRGEKITVYSAIKRTYTFSLSEITSVTRQIKKNRVKSERLVIKTAYGKKLIVESSMVSYKRFVKKVKSEVRDEYLFGFE